MKQINLLIGVTGSVATIKLPDIIQNLQNVAEKCHINLQIRIVATRNALTFVTESEFDSIDVRIYNDEQEWKEWKVKGDPVLHIELRRWAHVFAIVPLDANTLAKLAHGICDNLLTCVARAWDVCNGSMIVFPAMNTLMWKHPLTVRHLSVLNELCIKVINPIEKQLACGDCGVGALPEPEQVAKHILDFANSVVH